MFKETMVQLYKLPLLDNQQLLLLKLIKLLSDFTNQVSSLEPLVVQL